MSNVALRIGGRDYTVACAEGEEDHVRALGAIIAGKVDDMGSSAQGEVRQLLFAALLLADELHETRAKAQAANPDAHAPALEALATRLEKIATTLES
ncbi:cell division protein ZapA [Novosphingobium sp.]|uniref:cell division protein ZapA n=1 Tax=Novosphingobium sp. TaxID=1874826 RepID=UPI0035B008A4